MIPTEVTGRRRLAAALNAFMIAVVVPAFVYFHLFTPERTRTPGSRAALVALLALVWLALSLRPWASPAGRVWRWPARAAFFVGANLATALLMWAWRG